MRDGGAADGGPADAGPAQGALILYGCDAGYGSIGARIDGVAVFCQLDNLFAYYQCDELANRYMRDLLSHPNIDNVVTDFASEMCLKASVMSAYSVWGPGFRATAGRRPAPGDLVVWAGVPGHVAVVTTSSDLRIDFVQQNQPTLTGSLPWSAAASWFAADAGICWIHPEPAPPAAPPDGGACGCYNGQNDYCGLSIVNRSWWYGCRPGVSLGVADYDDLYACDGGVFTFKQTCSAGCISRTMTNNTGYCR